MSFAGVAVGSVAAGASLYGSYKSGKAADKAAKRQEWESEALQIRLDATAEQIQGYSDEYVNTLQDLDENFDPYNMEEAFNSLYEAVIQPMERDFDENVLPGIQASYSGGVMGAEAGLSGAASEATARAERGLSEKKADLRYQERGNAIARNYAEYDRRTNLAQNVYKGQSDAPMLRANMAPQIYGAQTDSIAATLAAGQAKAQTFNQAGSSLLAGANLYSNMNLSNKVGRYVDAKTANLKTRS